jgi:hypothetical protein
LISASRIKKPKDGAVLGVGDALSVTSLDYVVVIKLTDSIIGAASLRLRELIVVVSEPIGVCDLI